MIGKIYIASFPYYNKAKHKMDIKSRPMLVVGTADNEDYVVLPISTVGIQKNRDIDFDIEINPQNYPKLNLHKICFIRTHKRTVMHLGSLAKQISNLKGEYPDLFFEIMYKMDKFNSKILNEYIDTL